MSIRIIFFVILGKCVAFFIRIFSLGTASTWPGEIILRIYANFIRDSAEKTKLPIVLITGTNGKTTTSKLLSFILLQSGKQVVQNPEGANLLNGIASSIIKHADFLGNIPYDAAIFEVDENSFPQAARQMQPSAVILLNLFRDQLDRYGEVRSVANKWKKALRKLPAKTKIFLNGDDPEIYALGQHSNHEVYFFGVSERYKSKKEIPHDVDSVYCPNCGEKLDFSLIAYSHLGDFSCGSCGFRRKDVETFENTPISYPLAGVYNVYNTHAVLLCADKVFHIPAHTSIDYIKQVVPAFGRQEAIHYKGRKFFLLLSKNPTGFNQSIRLVKEKFSPDDSILLVLNDRIPDGTDVSWIWDVDFEELTAFSKRMFVAGDRAYDMGIRLRYSMGKNYPVVEKDNLVEEEGMVISSDLNEILAKAIEHTPADNNIIVLPTYSAMLAVRDIIAGRKLL